MKTANIPEDELYLYRLTMPLIDLPMHFEITPSGVGYAVQWGRETLRFPQTESEYRPLFLIIF